MIAIIGDTQTTTLGEVLLGREQNNRERTQIIKALADEKPDLLVHLGDHVAVGSSFFDWFRYDRLMKPVTDSGIPILPLIGNHDYFFLEPWSLSFMSKRFKDFGALTYGTQIREKTALVYLDSNTRFIGKKCWKAQLLWLAHELARLDNSSEVNSVLVFTHHPPFSNSVGHREKREVREEIVPLFFKSTKTRALISGHAHTYEHFEKQGKHFIVSGGGGGARVKIKKKSACKHEDTFQGSSLRPFHYLLFSATDKAITFEIKGFDKAEKILRSIDRFVVSI